jgi:minor extracellular serine protease Vpr
VKTKISLAISAALISGACFAGTGDKYNTTNQSNDDFAGLQVTKLERSKSTVSAWMIKLNVPSISQQNRTSNTDFSSAAHNVQQSQQRVKNAIMQLDADIQVVGQTSKLVNSILVKADQNQLTALLSNPDIADILPIYDYKLDVADSADYINATKVIAAGTATGKGQRVAVLDTGVDYTHKALGGSGLLADYNAAVAAKSEMPNWPQGKIVGGYDFMNDDPNPIDVSTNHGTHVSHSVVGIAPDVELYVYSVCNSSCPGLAQLNALEAAMDPNDDGNISDRVNTVNMSLGGDFGDRKEGAVQELIDEMVALGVNLVISAGNDGPTPFVVGGPSTSDGAISVGAMTHPTTKVGKIEALVAGETIEAFGAGFNSTNTFNFNDTTAPLVLPTANQNGCAAFAADLDFTGKAVIIDRGACGFTVKVLNAQNKGASFVIVANNVPNGGAFNMGGSNSAITIPSVMISKEDADALKAALSAGNGAYSIVSTEVLTAGAIATFTSRGPSIAGTLKPEITAPGTSIMTAHPGLGEGLTPISGTSFSSPITAGAMSIIKEALPGLNALEIKAIMMNSANLDVTAEPRGLNPDAELAPISYIGAGLVDVEKAINLPVIAWNKDTKQAALALGIVSLTETTTITKTIQVKNFSQDVKTYSLMAEQRFMNDIESGAVSFAMPASVTIKAGQTTSFDVKVTIDPTKLPEWSLTSSYELDGTAQEASDALTLSEYDGAIKFMDGDTQALHVVYHILPRAAAAVSVTTEVTAAGVVRTLTNIGSTSITDPFSAPLIATSPKNMTMRHDLLNASSELAESSSCDAGIAIYNTFQMRDPILHGLVASFNVDYDLNNDGEWDYTATTVNLQWFDDNYPRSLYALVSPYGTTDGTLQPAFHVTGNNFLTTKACFEDMGLAPTDLGSKITVRYRVEESDFPTASTGTGDEVTASLTLAPPDASAKLVKIPAAGVTPSAVESADDEEEVIELKPGESAKLVTQVGDNSMGYMLLSDGGAMSAIADTSDAGNSAPHVSNLELAIDKGTAGGTVLGQIMATDPDMMTSPIAEFIVLESDSNMITVNSSGVVSLSSSADINQDSETMTATVVVMDTMGNRSAPATVSVTINNTLPTVAPVGVTATEMLAVTVQANGQDTDGDQLTYTWVQTTGPAVTFANGTSSITFNAPAGDNVLKFSVTATDGRLTSTSGDATVTVNKVIIVPPTPQPKSGGSMGWLTMLLLPLAALRRRKS